MDFHTIEICAGVGMKPIPGFEGKYSATQNGEIYSHASQKTLKATASGGNRAYLSVEICGKSKSVHSLVLLAYSGPKNDGMEARHLNGNGKDNRPSNLQWSTHKENIADKVAHGTAAYGEKHGNCKFSNSEIEKIRALRKSGSTYPKIAELVGCSVSHAYRVFNKIDRKQE